MRRAARVDANQGDVVDAMRAVGAEVTPLHRVGQGVADLLVSFRARWFVMEVKDGAKVASKRALTPSEHIWITKQKARVHIVCNPKEAVDVLMRETVQTPTGNVAGGLRQS